jgi:competence protein ComEC
MDRPFVLILLSTIAGILISYFISIKSSMLFIALLLLILYSLFNLHSNKENYLLIILLFILIGALNTNINSLSTLKPYLDKRYDYYGIIDEIKEKGEGISKYIVNVKSVDGNSIREKMILNVIGNDEEFSLGDSISFNGALKLPMENTNPKLFNYKLYLLTKKIHTTMSVKEYSVNRVKYNENIFYDLKDKFQKDITSLFNKYLSSENSNLITAIILGKTDLVEEDELLKYRELGLAHILAVSGLHIGIIAGFINYLLSRIGIKRKLNFVITISIIYLYVALIGFPASAVRACIMFTILYFSQIVHEPYDTINTISFSMFICLLINPFWLFNIGFQLSYMAVISLFLYSKKIENLFYPWKNNFIMTLSSIIAVFVGLLPIQSYYFNRIQLMGFISNLIIVPLLSLSLIIAVFMIIFNYTFAFLNFIFGSVLELVLKIQYEITRIFYSFPINSIKVFSPDLCFILLYYLLLGIVFHLIDINKLDQGVKKSIVYYLLIFILISTIGINFDEKIEVDFIDVGQGDSILISTQGSTILMDTGGSFLTDDVGKFITLPYLEKHGINKLDAIIITHFDDDHYRGIFALLDEIRIGKVFSSYMPEDMKLLSQLRKRNIPIGILKESDILHLDKNTTLEILWPQVDINLSNFTSNNKSLVSKLRYKNFDILFTGDIESEAEEFMLSKNIHNIDILKIPHHGSNTSSTIEFLEKTEPTNSIISVGRNNFYNHPNEEVLKRLDSVKSKIFRTDEMGRIKVILDKDKYDITSFLKRNQDLTIISTTVLYFLISYILIKNYNGKEGVLIGI